MNFTHRIDDQIVLRVVEPRHAEELFDLILRSRDSFGPWMPWTRSVQSEDDVRDGIRSWLTQTAEIGGVSVGIEVDGTLSGMIYHLHPNTKHRIVEIGYWLSPQCRGRGVATRCLRAMIDYTIRDLGFNRVTVRVAPQNEKSNAVAKRVGCVLEGVSRQAWKVDGVYYDANEYSVLANEWQPNGEPWSFSHRVDDEIELRLLEPRHAEALYELIDANHEHVGRWMSWLTDTYALKDSESFIERNLIGLAGGRGATFGVFCNGERVGSVGNNDANLETRTADIGYWMAQDAQGRGIMTRAARAMVDYSLIDMGLNRVTIHAAAENPRSQAVAQRLGFEQVAVMRKSLPLHNEFIDTVHYAMLAEDWKAKA